MSVVPNADAQETSGPRSAVGPVVERWNRIGIEAQAGLEWIRYNQSAVLPTGRTDEAAAAIAPPRRREASSARLAVAESFLTQGQFKRAIDQYQQALAAGPLSADALNHLGYALLQEGRAAEAEQFLRLSVAAQTSNAAAYSNLGNALQQLGRLEESFSVYRLALAAPGGAQQPETHNDFGVALARAGRMDEAIVQFREAVRLDPSYTAARDNLTKAVRATARLAAARWSATRFALDRSVTEHPQAAADSTGTALRRPDRADRETRASGHDNERPDRLSSTARRCEPWSEINDRLVLSSTPNGGSSLRHRLIRRARSDGVSDVRP